MTKAFRPVDSLQMMAYIIGHCVEKDIALNVTKLQKLMYCCYGCVLARFGARLTDEYPEAWQFGPVFPEALRSARFFSLDDFLGKATPEVTALPADVIALVNDAVDYFGQFKAAQLSDWSQRPNSPWARATHGGKFLYSRLEDSDISSYFRRNVLA
ncbi:Panacea domain-containing protein [Sutterella sp.]|uniref:Panacea domain-containing protein n=1 Tax=Sutterella sp. TaxID=1981025 RepID=UPI0026E06E02|nr:type II toxin-antitoxin system antitoxin SocA domain-containing protein [Sutterella sp.]MDO5531972.1 DUF4065 domain-containing protein [Sutterella sp.]